MLRDLLVQSKDAESDKLTCAKQLEIKRRSLVSTGCVSGQGEELAWCPADLTAALAGD